MTQEYLIEEQVHNLDPTPDQVKVAAKGYPSFMRESTARVKKPVPDLDNMVRIKKEYIPQVKKEFVEKVDDCDKLYKTKGKLIQEYVHDYTQDHSLVIDAPRKDSAKEPRSSSRRSTGSRSSKNGSESSNRQQKYYHIEIDKTFVHKSSADADNFDYHQRKSKEIRRLQYMADLECKKVKLPAPV